MGKEEGKEKEGRVAQAPALFLLFCSTPVFPLIREALALAKDRSNRILFLTYEDMKTDLRPELRRMQEFLGVRLSEEQLARLEAAVAFDAIKTNPLVNKENLLPSAGRGHGFIRKGIVGDWKNHFDEQMDKEWEPWIRRELEGMEEGFKMRFEA